MSSAQWMLGFASIFTLAGLASIAISFSTDYWIVSTVDREKAIEDDLDPVHLAKPIAFTRNRGLFRTCYEGNDTVFLDTLDNDDVVDGNCVVEKGYELSRRSKTNSYASEYDIRIHLMRSHFAFFIVSMLFFIIGIILGIVGCWQIRVSILQIAGLIVFIAAFFAAGGMAMFHGYDYLEREKLDEVDEDWPAFWDNDDDLEALADNTKREYGWSYMLGWIGVCLGAIGAILFLCASFSYKPKRPKEKELPYTAYGNEGYDYGYPTYPASSYGAQNYYGYGY